MGHPVTDSAGARSAILNAIKLALRDEPKRELPAPAPVFAAERPLEPAELARMFQRELAALAGETIFVPSAAELPLALERALSQRHLETAAVQNSSRVTAALAHIPGDRFFQAAGASQERIEAAHCGIIEAQALLAVSLEGAVG